MKKIYDLKVSTFMLKCEKEIIKHGHIANELLGGINAISTKQNIN